MGINEERDHRRYVTAASYWSRDLLQVVRHQDVDLMQLCSGCGQPEWVMEAKPRWVPPSQWENTRLMARSFGAWALLDIEPFRRDRCPGKISGCPCPDHTNNSQRHEIEIQARDAEGRPIDKQILRHDGFVEFIRNIHEDHVRRGHNPDWWKRADQIPREQRPDSRNNP